MFFIYYCEQDLHVGTMETLVAFHILLSAGVLLIIAGLLWVCPSVLNPIIFPQWQRKHVFMYGYISSTMTDWEIMFSQRTP